MRAGGGVNHRGSLSDFVLIKDNHLAGLTITQAVHRALERWPGRTVEVECDRLEQVIEALTAGATLIMCDNMTPEEVRECVAVVAGRCRRVLGSSRRDARVMPAAGDDYLPSGYAIRAAFDLGLVST